jgi:trans-aconitate methyltransferase
MTDWDTTTIKTYDDSTAALAEYFKGIGPRKLYIDLAFKLIGNKEDAKVIEIGCGDGRDATEIIKLTNDYVGFDPSSGMIELAKERLPKTSFKIDDALSFSYPQNVDLVFAFASLLHVDIKDLEKIITRIAHSIKSGGLLYISLKESIHFEEKIKEDQFGKRMFYYYSVPDILAFSKQHFDRVAEIHETIGKTNWFELGLRRK